MKNNVQLPTDYFISDKLDDMQLKVVHQYLSQESYWAKNISFELVQKAAANSINFGVFYKQQQVGYARVITDCATFGYLADVYILTDHRGKGLSKCLMQAIQQHPDLQVQRRFVLVTADAHGLYEQFDWKAVANPTRYMEKVKVNPYVIQNNIIQ